MTCPYFTDKQKTLDGELSNFCAAMGYKPQVDSTDLYCKTDGYPDCGAYRRKNSEE